MKKIFKAALFRSFHGLKLDRCPWPGGYLKTKIFFAHRVIKTMDSVEAGNLFQYIKPQAIEQNMFIERLEWLFDHWRFIPLDDFIRMRTPAGKVNGKRYAALTFDDAYSDFLHVVSPILNQLEIPATFFITVKALDQAELLWFDKYYSAIAGSTIDQFDLTTIENRIIFLGSIDQKVNSIIELGKMLTNLGPKQRDETVREIVEKIGPGPLKAKSLYLSREDLKDLASKPGVTIGSHTLSHPNLLRLTESELRRELQDSKNILEEITEREVKHLSYPSGLWNERVITVARACGYVSAYSTAKGMAGNGYALPRVNIGWWPDAEFKVKTSKLWCLL